MGEVISLFEVLVLSFLTVFAIAFTKAIIKFFKSN